MMSGERKLVGKRLKKKKKTLLGFQKVNSFFIRCGSKAALYYYYGYYKIPSEYQNQENKHVIIISYSISCEMPRCPTSLL
jgi:hypothetical protein